MLERKYKICTCKSWTGSILLKILYNALVEAVLHDYGKKMKVLGFHWVLCT